MRNMIFEEFKLIVARTVVGGIVIVDDAGITSTLKAIDRGRDSVKGHRVWQVLESAGAEYEVLRTPGGHGTQLKVPLDARNRPRIVSALRD